MKEPNYDVFVITAVSEAGDECKVLGAFADEEEANKLVSIILEADPKKHISVVTADFWEAQ